MGKSRLAAEFLAATEATVVRGRCLSYGEGITYWPVVEVLKQLEAHRSRLEFDPAADHALTVLLGRRGTSSTTDEIAWAFRKLLEAVAAEGPLLIGTFRTHRTTMGGGSSSRRVGVAKSDLDAAVSMGRSRPVATLSKPRLRLSRRPQAPEFAGAMIASSRSRLAAGHRAFES